MEPFAPLLLEVWRQACRNLRIDASMQGIAPCWRGNCRSIGC